MPRAFLWLALLSQPVSRNINNDGVITVTKSLAKSEPRARANRHEAVASFPLNSLMSQRRALSDNSVCLLHNVVNMLPVQH